VNIINILIALSFIVLSIGVGVVSVSRDLVRLLIGLEVLFLSGLTALVILYLTSPIRSSILTFTYIASSIMETTLMIGLLYYLARSGYRVIEEKEIEEEVS